MKKLIITLSLILTLGITNSVSAVISGSIKAEPRLPRFENIDQKSSEKEVSFENFHDSNLNDRFSLTLLFGGFIFYFLLILLLFLIRTEHFLRALFIMVLFVFLLFVIALFAVFRFPEFNNQIVIILTILGAAHVLPILIAPLGIFGDENTILRLGFIFLFELGGLFLWYILGTPFLLVGSGGGVILGIVLGTYLKKKSSL